MDAVEIKIVRLDPNIPLPKKMHKEDAAYDICSRVDTVLEPKSFKMIPTGIKVEIPIGYRIDVRSRSGLAAKYGIFCLNSPGTIDSGYREEIHIILANFSDKPFEIHKYDRIAQILVQRNLDIIFKEIREDELDSEIDRKGGFGSTGLK